MPKIIAYQCPKTKKIFADRAKFTTHLLGQRRDSYNRARQKRLNRSFLDILAVAQQSLTTIEDIANWMKDHLEDILAYHYGLKVIADPHYYKDYTEWNRDFQLLHFDFTGHHEAEMKVTSFDPLDHPYGKFASYDDAKAVMDNDDRHRKPLTYAGIAGHVRIGYSGGHGDFPTKPFEIPGISIGSGGGSYNNARYKLKIFFDNWTALKEAYEIDIMTDTIKGIR